MKSKENIQNLTGIEIMHNVLLWCYNWTEDDFQVAFKDSHLGWDYFWDRLQGKCKNGNDPTEAIVGIILNMDAKHQQMLFNHIFKKQAKGIKAARDWKIKIEKALAEQKAKEIKKSIIK